MGIQKMRISDCVVGKTYIVKEIGLGLDVKRRLEILGMTINSTVEVVNSKRSGSKIIKVRGTRFAIGKKFAEGIEVAEKNSGLENEEEMREGCVL